MSWGSVARALSGALGATFVLLLLLGGAVSSASAAPSRSEGGVPDPPAFDVEIAATPQTGPPPLDVSFAAAVAGAVGSVNITWQFGDGGTSRGVDATHLYKVPGTYTAKATAVDSTGSSASAEMNISVGAAAVASSGDWNFFGLSLGELLILAAIVAGAALLVGPVLRLARLERFVMERGRRPVRGVAAPSGGPDLLPGGRPVPMAFVPFSLGLRSVARTIHRRPGGDVSSLPEVKVAPWPAPSPPRSSSRTRITRRGDPQVPGVIWVRSPGAAWERVGTLPWAKASFPWLEAYRRTNGLTAETWVWVLPKGSRPTSAPSRVGNAPTSAPPRGPAPLGRASLRRV
ncbi:MAG: PKD domain-containing protein [Euryarchaeota archaeon]|nr:PKD domain-containing protein [Euryarchaeota archaeon]